MAAQRNIIGNTAGNGATSMPGQGKNRAAYLAEYEVVALVLQGGGALGSYQAGFYEGLAAAHIKPAWV
ncbi:MAG: hypothetical protein WAX67_01355, partial [Rugosibacter sp.]